MQMAEISVDLIQMVYYHADSCALSLLAFLFLPDVTNLLVWSLDIQALSLHVNLFTMLMQTPTSTTTTNNNHA